MPVVGELSTSYAKGRHDARTFDAFMERAAERPELDEAHRTRLLELKEQFANDPNAAVVYASMEFYDREDNDIKGGSGLGVLAGASTIR